MEAPKELFLTEEDIENITDFRAFDERVKYIREDIVEQQYQDFRELLISFSKWLQSRNEEPWSSGHVDAFLEFHKVK